MRRFKLWKSASDIDAVLRARIRQAYQDVPLYQRLGEMFRIQPESIRTVYDLSTLPIISKTDLVRDTPEDHLHPNALTRKTQVRVTSGTTGWEVDTHMTRAELNFRRYIFLRRIWFSAGRPFPMKLAQAGSWIEPGPQGEVRHTGTWPLHVVHISRRLSPKQQAAVLAAERATVIIGCPSALDVIAAELPDLDVRWHRPRLIITRGEILRPQMKRNLEHAFRSSVLDFYSAEETGLIAWQCPENPDIMHVEQDACIVEIVDPSGVPVPAGTPGDIVVTNLFNRTMPLIRYRIGDQSEVASKSDFTCTCSRIGTSIRAPFGRPDDFIILPDGERISPTIDTVGLTAVPQRKNPSKGSGVFGPAWIRTRDLPLIRRAL